MTIEDKAERYDELLKKLRKAKIDNNVCDERYCCVIDDIVPELKESEDERIRKGIIKFLIDVNNGAYTKSELEIASWIAWLEKQGETQGKSALEAIKEEKVDNANKVEPKDYSSIDPHFFKPVDKVEPKFKVGDWVIHQGTENIYQVVAVIDNQYQLKYGDNYTIQKCADVDRCARLWDITKDAKDGDVLAFKDDSYILLVKDVHNTIYGMRASCYCHVLNEKFEVAEYQIRVNGLYPATKEQRDLLFQKMQEAAGYEWDEDKKELRKIVVPIFNIGDTIVKKHNSDINKFGQFTITDISGGKYWYDESIICDITEQNDWEIYEPVRQTTVEWSMDKVEKIKAEIERRKSLADEKKDNNIYFFARSDAYMELLNFIDSLEEDSDCKYNHTPSHPVQR